MHRDPDAIFGQLDEGYLVADRYRIRGLVGKGGSGVIYAALDTESGQQVALKTLNADLLSHPSAVARYHREARSAASIGHPNICSVLDAGQLTDGRPFLVMELLTGATLSERIRDEGAMPFPLVLSVMSQTLSALAAAHGKKIVHRDIKPDNVFLTDRIQGVVAVKLLDFGIAKSLDENAELSLTRTGMVVGTPFYMAPEQARGEQLDHRVDLYACGVLLYEMLTGRRPFHATNYNALMLQVLTMDPPDPRNLRPAIPAQFVAIVQRAMAKDRDGRYADAAAFLSAIQLVQRSLAQGPSQEEVARIAQAVVTPPGRAPRDSFLSDDIPVYHDSSPPESLLIVEEHDDDDETVTRPFLRPEQLRRPKPPVHRREPAEATEVMLDAPWLEHREDPDTEIYDPPTDAPSEPASWDDDTRVEPPPFEIPHPSAPKRVTGPPKARASSRDLKPPAVPYPPPRVPRPRRKG